MSHRKDITTLKHSSGNNRGSPASVFLPRDASATALLREEFWKPAQPPCCSRQERCKAEVKDMCKGRGKKGEGWRELMSRLLSKRLIPILAGQRGRGGLGKPFPRGKLMPPLGDFPSFFLCLSFVPPIHGRDSSKARGFVFLPRALTRGEFQGWHWGACAHTP